MVPLTYQRKLPANDKNLERDLSSGILSGLFLKK